MAIRGMLTSFFRGRRSASTKSDELTIKELLAAAQKVAEAYGAILSQEGLMARDVKELPYSKEAIKTSLRALMAANLDPDLREHLAVAYVSLATFQNLTATEMAWLQNWHQIYANVSHTEGSALRKALEDAGPQAMGVLTRVNVEMESLRQELEAGEVSSR
jgi:hypothetical protein